MIESGFDINSLGAIFIFDKNYVSAAIVSVVSFLEIPKDYDIKVTMIYLGDRGDADDVPSHEVLNEFKNKSSALFGGNIINIIEIKGDIFNDYINRNHFNSTVLYKIVIPKVLGSYHHILVFDCGLIFGTCLSDFINFVVKRIEDKTIAAVTAFCTPSSELSKLNPLLSIDSNKCHYPAGVILYFDVRKYELNNMYERFISCYLRHRESLVYAEQEILCIALDEDELGQFQECGPRYHIDMAISDWSQSSKDVSFYKHRKYLYMKHIGSFKPWKKWVLHPSKAIFLWEKAAVIDKLKFARPEMLDDAEIIPSRVDFLGHQLRRIEIDYTANKVFYY